MIKDDLSDEARQAVLEYQNRFWLALQRKDAALFAEVLSEDFVSRSPGQEDQGRAAFIATLTTISLSIIDIRGEAIAIQILDNVAVLTGTQVAQMRFPNGEMISQRLALTNVFQYKAGVWKMMLAHPVSLPVTD